MKKRKSQYQKPRSGAFSNCQFCGGNGCLACPGERTRAEAVPVKCFRCGRNITPPGEAQRCVMCLKPLCTPCFTDNKRCQDCVNALAEMKSKEADRLSELGDYPLGKLYRDWLSVRDGKESAYPSPETLRVYQGWAEELLAGGKREWEGEPFRRFCRLRQSARHMDLMTVGAALDNGQDCPAPEGWKMLNEPTDPNDLHDAMQVVTQQVNEIKKLHDAQEQVDAFDKLEAMVRQLQIDNGWIMTGSENRIAHARLEAKKVLRGLHRPGHTLHQGIVLGRGDAPTGALTIIYLESGETLWNADMRHFIHRGPKQFFAAWEWLENQVATDMKRETIRVLHKDYDGDYTRITERSKISEGEMLHKELLTTYNPPPVPADWDTPSGTSLCSMVRGLLKLAHYHAKQGSHADAPVFYTDLVRIFRDMFGTHLVFGCIPTDKRGQLWGLEKWIADMKLEVIKRKTYRYVQPDDRRLATKHKTSKATLLQALMTATGEKRSRTILSELEDQGWLPVEYLPSKDTEWPY